MADRLAALKAGDWLDFSHNDSPKCPHCGSDFSISENEAWHLYDDDDAHEVECGGCDLPFTVATHTTYAFSTDEQDADE